VRDRCLALVPPGISSLKERAGVKGWLTCAFRVRAPFAGRAELTSWLLSPHSCPFPCEPGPAGSRTGGRRPGRAAAPEGVLDAVAREPVTGAGGEASPRGERLGGYAVIGAPSPAVRLAGLLAAFIPSGVPRPGWPGGMGRFASGTGGANHVSVLVAALAGAGCGEKHKTSRPRARPGRQLTLPGWQRGGYARRAWRRTPGSAGSARRRSWRCRGRRRHGG